MTAATTRPRNPHDHSPPAPSGRALLLWVTLGLFLFRVIGQVEVWLLAPDWLPPMDARYSGLLPYPVLLPAQIMLLMAMVYFGVIVVRLALTIRTHGDEFYLHGAIPIAFDWALALFLLALAGPASRQRRSGDSRTANGSAPA